MSQRPDGGLVVLVRIDIRDVLDAGTVPRRANIRAFGMKDLGFQLVVNGINRGVHVVASLAAMHVQVPSGQLYFNFLFDALHRDGHMRHAGLPEKLLELANLLFDVRPYCVTAIHLSECHVDVHRPSITTPILIQPGAVGAQNHSAIPAIPRFRQILHLRGRSRASAIGARHRGLHAAFDSMTQLSGQRLHGRFLGERRLAREEVRIGLQGLGELRLIVTLL